MLACGARMNHMSSSAPVDDLTARGYQSPYNTQFSVFLDNRVGRLLDLLEVFEGQAVRVAALSVIDSADHAVVRLVTSHSDLARNLLKRHRLPFAEAEILVVELGEGQTMTSMCTTLLAAELNIHYAYPLLIRPRNKTAIGLHTDDQHLAGQLLRRKLFTLLAEIDLADTGNDLPGNDL